MRLIAAPSLRSFSLINYRFRTENGLNTAKYTIDVMEVGGVLNVKDNKTDVVECIMRKMKNLKMGHRDAKYIDWIE